MKDTLEALTGLIDAFKRLYQAIGAVPSGVIVATILLALYFVHRAKLKGHDAGWERALGAKDAHIEQINGQNRDFRIQLMVMGGKFSVTEAREIVLGPPDAGKKGEA